MAIKFVAILISLFTAAHLHEINLGGLTKNVLEYGNLEDLPSNSQHQKESEVTLVESWEPSKLLPSVNSIDSDLDLTCHEALLKENMKIDSIQIGEKNPSLNEKNIKENDLISCERLYHQIKTDFKTKIESNRFTSFLPYIFVSAASVNHMDEVSSSFNLEEFLLSLFCVLELVFCLSHILVHLGIRNSRYNFLTKQKIYFALDGSTTTLNLILFWNQYYYIKFVLFYAIILHSYYVFDLVFYKGKSRIFFWSASDKVSKRFSLEFLRENVETFIDDSCHFFGFLMSFMVLSVTYKMISVSISIILLWKLVLTSKYFFTKKHMMPQILSSIIEDDNR